MINKEALIVALVNHNRFSCTDILDMTDVLEKVYADGKLIHAPMVSTNAISPTNPNSECLNAIQAEIGVMLKGVAVDGRLRVTHELLLLAIDNGWSFGEFRGRFDKIMQVLKSTT